MSNADKLRAERYLDRVRELEQLVSRLRSHLAEAVALGSSDDEADVLEDASTALRTAAKRERSLAAGRRHRDIRGWQAGRSRHVPVEDASQGGTPVALQPMGVKGHPGTAWVRWLP